MPCNVYSQKHATQIATATGGQISDLKVPEVNELVAAMFGVGRADAVGSIVLGVPDGEILGASVGIGAVVGEIVGDEDGEEVGASVGNLVGSRVGAEVGEGEVVGCIDGGLVSTIAGNSRSGHTENRLIPMSES